MGRTTALTTIIGMLVAGVLSSASAAGTAGAAEPEPPPPWEVVEVTASGSDGNLPEGTLDGLLSTRWSAQTVDVQDPQWIQFDLGSRRAVGYLGIAWHQGDARASSYAVQVSDDAQAWQTVVADGTSSGTSIDLEPVVLDDAAPDTGVVGRYLRYLGYGNSSNGWNSLTEVRLYPPNPDGPVVHSFVGNVPQPDPDAQPFTAPGLTEPDGSRHRVPPRNPVTGQTVDVTEHGADPADTEHDDTPAIAAAIAAASPGDEVYLPAGVYNLRTGTPSDPSSNVALRSGVNLRGDGQHATILRSSYTASDANSKVLRGYGISDVVISDLTVTSTFDGPFSEDHRADAGGGPQYGIFLSDAVTRPSTRVHVERVTVERFERMGVRIASSQDVVVSDCTFRDATSVGGGGRGYGVSIQGIPKTDRVGFPDDSRHNVVRNSTFEGPHLRHGVLLQFMTHNNLVADNTFHDVVLDAIDLHGEGEYLNEIRGNRITAARAAAIALGNTGGTAPSNHSASGPGNWIHRNTITGVAREGIKVHMGSPDTLIERNVISRLTGPARARGIQVLNAPGTVVRDNVIVGNRTGEFWGVHLGTDPGDPGADGVGSGVPRDVTIARNTIVGNDGGILLEAGEGTVLSGNRLRNNGEDLRDDVVPGEDDELTVHLPTDDTMIDLGAPTASFGDASLLRWKRNASGTVQRIVYYRFEVDDPATITSAHLTFSARLTASNPVDARYEFAVKGVPEDAWTEAELTWQNAPVTDPVDAEPVAVFELAAPLEQVQRIAVDVTEHLRAQTDGTVTFVVVDEIGQNANVDSYSKERADASLRPELVIQP